MKWIACPICKVISLNRGLCELCLEKAWHWREPFVRAQSGYVIRSLFRWRRDGWLGLQWWLKSLKNKENDLYWREIASWALDIFPNPSGHQPVLLVPIPSRSKNHALGFVRSLARNRPSWRVYEGLALTSDCEQKSREWQERWLRRFRWRGPELQLCKDYTSVIIVDDVVTTGATAEAAVQCLGRPERTEVWVLADRRPCGASAALL